MAFIKLASIGYFQQSPAKTMHKYDNQNIRLSDRYGVMVPRERIELSASPLPKIRCFKKNISYVAHLYIWM